jgi:hypothetical protein
VKLNCAIRQLLAILLIAGLALAPVSRPAMAKMFSSDMSIQAMSDMSAPATTDEMANEMPCCPSNVPASVDCGKCVFMSACMSKCFAGMSAAVFHPLLVASGGIAVGRNDSRTDGLGQPPPEHPPRILV